MEDPKNEQWNICDDFLDPLVEILSDFDIMDYADIDGERLPKIRGGRFHWVYMESGYTRKGYLMMVYACMADRSFAKVWFQVHQSVALADRLGDVLLEIQEAVEGYNTAAVQEHRIYLQQLSIVLRDAVVQKSNIPEDFCGPYSAKELYSSKKGAGLLGGVSTTKFYEMVKENRTLFRKVPNGYRVHRSLLRSVK